MAQHGHQSKGHHLPVSSCLARVGQHFIRRRCPPRRREGGWAWVRAMQHCGSSSGRGSGAGRRSAAAALAGAAAVNATVVVLSHVRIFARSVARPPPPPSARSASPASRARGRRPVGGETILVAAAAARRASTGRLGPCAAAAIGCGGCSGDRSNDGLIATTPGLGEAGHFPPPRNCCNTGCQDGRGKL